MEPITKGVLRTPYMQSLLEKTRHFVALKAVSEGKLEEAWEKLIASEIHTDFLNDHPEACEIVESVMIPGEAGSKTYMKAAYLITSSKIASHDPDDLKDVRFGQ